MMRTWDALPQVVDSAHCPAVRGCYDCGIKNFIVG